MLNYFIKGKSMKISSVTNNSGISFKANATSEVADGLRATFHNTVKQYGENGSKTARQVKTLEKILDCCPNLTVTVGKKGRYLPTYDFVVIGEDLKVPYKAGCNVLSKGKLFRPRNLEKLAELLSGKNTGEALKEALKRL